MKRHPFCKHKFPHLKENKWCAICDLLKEYDKWRIKKPDWSISYCPACQQMTHGEATCTKCKGGKVKP